MYLMRERCEITSLNSTSFTGCSLSSGSLRSLKSNRGTLPWNDGAQGGERRGGEGEKRGMDECT